MKMKRAGRADASTHAEVFSWNPQRAPFGGPLARFWPWKRPVNNFGDLLGPLIVERMVALSGRDAASPEGSWQLLSVGSVMHFARDGAVVWGAGVNGKMDPGLLRFETLDVRAVRGPRTATLLRGRGITVPDVFGDPALLIPRLFPELLNRPSAEGRHRVAIVPNLNDAKSPIDAGADATIIDPRLPVHDVLAAIARSDFVAASSLHGLIVAEALGIPARMVMPDGEHVFKYQDYYESTGRTDFHPAKTFAEAIAAGGEEPLVWDPQPLLAAFPAELWQPTERGANG